MVEGDSCGFALIPVTRLTTGRRPANNTDASSDMLPVVQASELPTIQVGERWQIEGLWTHQGVGLIAASPKSGKSWAAFDMAVSVASGTPCLGYFPVPPEAAGPVLAFSAEDGLPFQRERLTSICGSRGLDLADLPLHVITAAGLRLDIERDQQRLLRTLDAVEPRLLVLDCLVRLHRLPENDAGAISGLLGWIRSEINRKRSVAVVVVHHASKRGGTGGAAIRGSSDLHAWSDTNLYLRRCGSVISMSIEHRSAPSPDPVQLVLSGEPHPHLEIAEGDESDDDLMPAATSRVIRNLDDEVLSVLQAASEPVGRGALRDRLRVRNTVLGDALERLEAASEIVRDGRRWRAM